MSNIPPDPPDPPTSAGPSTSSGGSVTTQSVPRRGRNRGRGRGRGQSQLALIAENELSLSTSDGQGEPRPRTTQAQGHPTSQSENVAASLRKSDGGRGPSKGSQDTSQGSNNTRRVGGKLHEQHSDVPQSEPLSTASSRNQGRSRRGLFGSQLTVQRNARVTPLLRRPSSPPLSSDLTTRLTYVLRTPPYQDCPICFNSLHPAQATWSCSLSDQATSCCWATFHLKCVREWGRKSTKEIRDAFVAREVSEEEYWRCPGCQTKRHQVPESYRCFCGAINDPKPGIATPHSCGMACSRRRTLCDHPCPLSCHPGPCPPCILTVHPSCHCNKTTLSIRCARSHASLAPSLSCRQTCGRLLLCGNHRCEKDCHPGQCEPCRETEIVRCFCGNNSTQVGCGGGGNLKQEAFVIDKNGHETTWEGRYDCGNKCDRPFDCGLHTCSKSCHVPSPTAARCPFDPTLVTTCPCGKQSLSELMHEQRTRCTDPIPICTMTCGKHLQGCNHCCSAPCHLGACPPCSISVTVACRCGLTARSVPCSERQHVVSQGMYDVLCDKLCGTLRLCGRHQCSRICCPLASMSRSKVGKGKKNKNPPPPSQGLMDKELEDAEKLWHECNLICGKMLGCGSHKCTERDHRGPCPPCLQSSFEELVCHCGRTVIVPPIPCGTRINCTFPCEQPSLLCGHTKTAHNCHEDPSQCPPCPFLTTKRCACGKSDISNVRCSQEKVSCGQPCGKLLDCGFHKCQRLCHDGNCGACSSVCGKPRKLCLPTHHPCSLPCHAPSACNESEPCGAMVTITCPCGRLQQPSICGRRDSNQEKTAPQLECRDECSIAKRNARLAIALGISGTKNQASVVYSDDIVSFGKENPKFVAVVEKTLNEFVVSDKKTHVLPYMPENRRRFVKELCQLYRIDTLLVDQEPRRSVQLHRRIDTRTPTPVLTAFIASQNVPPSLGKLMDSRRGMTPTTRTVPPATRSSIGPSSSHRGWTSVVSATVSQTSQDASSSSTSHRIVEPKPLVPVQHSNSSVRENWDSD